jgi:PAS domain S-box-containing protein
MQQSNGLMLTKTFTAANDPAIKAFLQAPSAATRSGASEVLQKLDPPEDSNHLQLELWDTNQSLVLTLPDGASPQELDLREEFKASDVAPFKTTGPMRVIKEIITAPTVVAVKDDSGKPIGHLVRWRRMSLSPRPKQLTDLLGSEAALYFGNIQGDLLTDLERITSKPRAELGLTAEVMDYSRDGNRVMGLGRPISGTPWFVLVEFPEEPLLVPAHRFLRRIVLIDLILLTVGIGGALALSRRITQPLQALTEAASAISGGDYSKTVDVQSRDELGLLAAGFNAMTTKVRASQSELEENVQALRGSEQHLQTVIENLSEGLILSDLDGQLLHWNRAALDMHGFASLEDCLLKVPEFTDIFELSDANGSVLDLEQWPLPRILRGELLRHVETRIRRIHSDWERFFSYGGTIVNQVSGERIAIVTVSDITERERALREIHRLNDELELRVIERTTQLEAANKEMEAFSYSASHDLRAPLRHLAGYASLLQKNGWAKLDENSRRYVNTIIEESGRMGDLIDHLLNFSRLGRAALQKRPVDLQYLVNEVVANTAVPDGQHIRWTISDLPEVSADSALLRLVFENLISNAVKFTRKSQEPQIEIGCSSVGHQVVLFVKDNGEGFDTRYIDKLFGVFQRLHRADEFEGTGIGLANVRRIISRHGGTTWAEGIVGKGATFFLTLPR